MPRLLDLFCGRFGWSKAFAARGWECVGVDLVEPPEIPEGCEFVQEDIFRIEARKDGIHMMWKGAWGWSSFRNLGHFDFICASSPCEQFSVHGMKHFHPNPPYPELGIKLFNHTRSLCEASGVPYVMENVRAAQAFVGTATHHCGPFYLWGSGVPSLMPQGIKKGLMSTWIDSVGRIRTQGPQGRAGRAPGENTVAASNERTAKAATIPPELSNAVCDYAEALMAQREVMA